MRLNEIKQIGTRWGVFLNSNHPLLNGIKDNVFFGAHKVEILGPT